MFDVVKNVGFLSILSIITVCCGRSTVEDSSRLRNTQNSEDSVRFGYRLGLHSVAVGHDKGAGNYNSVPASNEKKLERKVLLTAVLPAAYRAVGEDAARHMRHYLENTGEPLEINLESMILSSRSTKKHYRDELFRAVKFCQDLEVGIHELTAVSANGGYNNQIENRNWYFAVGGYASWGQAVVNVFEVNGKRHYRMIFNYHFADRYNWDGDKSVIIAGRVVTDEALGEMHRMGLAREFDMTGKHKRVFEWSERTPAEEVYLDWPQLKLTEEQQASFVIMNDLTSNALPEETRDYNAKTFENMGDPKVNQPGNSSFGTDVSR